MSQNRNHNHNNQNENFYEKFMPKKSPKVAKKELKKQEENKRSYEKVTTEKLNTAKKDLKNKFEKKPSDKGLNKNTTERNKNKVWATDALLTSKASAFSSKAVPKDAQKVLSEFDKIIQENRPLNSKQIQLLPDNIRELSHELTDRRADRRLGYMNENTKLSAYVRYFTWWNLVRLTKLFSNLPEEAFPTEDCICLDLGSGPLTVISALWLARPNLRKKTLTWYCLDVSQNSMIFGEDLYYSIAARTQSKAIENEETEKCWKIIRVKGSFGTQLKEKADFISCANMLNELDQAGDMPPEFQTKRYFDQLQIYSKKEARFILVEPGVPKAARTLALLRDRFIKSGKQILAPCAHALDCPMNGFKAYTGSSHKWCNFAFSTEDAPARLQKLSDSAKLPKERATLSFLCAIQKNEMQKNEFTSSNTFNSENTLLVRIVSDPFRLPGNRTGVYACSKLGLTIIAQNASIKDKADENDKKKPDTVLESGDLLEVKIKTPVNSLKTDEKTGAKIIAL